MSDITYIDVQKEAGYNLTSVMDLDSKKMMGDHCSKQLTTDHMILALKNVDVSQKQKN